MLTFRSPSIPCPQCWPALERGPCGRGEVLVPRHVAGEAECRGVAAPGQQCRDRVVVAGEIGCLEAVSHSRDLYTRQTC